MEHKERSSSNSSPHDDLEIVVPSDNSAEEFDYSTFYLKRLKFYSFAYQLLVDEYKHKTTNVYILIKFSSLLSAAISLISVFTAPINVYLNIVSTISTLVIAIIVELLQKLYPQDELSNFSKFLRMVDFRLGKLESLPPNIQKATLHKNITKMAKLLSEAPSMSLKQYNKIQTKYQDFCKENSNIINKV